MARDVTRLRVTGRKRMEAELAAQEREFRSLAENLPEPIIRYDLDGRRRYVNPAYETFFGIPAHAAMGKTVGELSSLTDAPAFMAEFQAAARGESREFDVVTPVLGAPRTYRMHLMPERDDTDTPTGVLAIAHDVSEERQAQAQIARFLANAPGYAYTMCRDSRGRDSLPFVSPGIGKLVGLTPEALHADMTPLRALYHPDDCARLLNAFAESVATLAPVRVEYRFRHPERGEFWVENRAMPERRANGEIHWHGIVFDIDERRRMENELRQREGMFRALVENSPDTIARYDRECRRIYANPVLLAGIGDDPAAGLGKTPTETFPGSAMALAYEQAIRQVFSKGAGKAFMLSWRDARQREVWSHIRLVAEHDEEGAVVSTLAIGRDITESKAAEIAREAALAEAERLVRLRSDFMAQMSHELRTPLNGILGFTQLMEKQDGLSGELRKWTGIIRDNGEHLLALINQVLDFAKIEAGKLTLACEDIRLAGLLDMAITTIRVDAEKKKLAVDLVRAPDLPAFVRGDLLRLRQILLNLLGNAVKFTERGRVELRVRQPAPGRLRFEVRDTGPGIEATKLDCIFEPFEQIEDGGRTREGTGLGLAISRKLAQLMGGDIEIESRPGEGSTFALEIDAAASVAADATDVPPVAGGTAPPPRAEAEAIKDARELPPRAELDALLELARHGYLRRIVRRAAELDAAHAPFAAQLGQLARSYRSKEIVNYLQHCLERKAFQMEDSP